MLVLGAVVDEEEQARGRQAFDEAVEQRLGLGVDPVQVLEEDEQGLDLALPEQQPLDAVERALAALRRIEALPLEVVDGQVEQAQKGRQPGRELTVEGEELAGHFLANVPRVDARLDLEVALEEIDRRADTGGLAVGNGARLAGSASPRSMGMRELPVQARLAHAGLADDRYDLTVAGTSVLEGLAQLRRSRRRGRRSG